MNKHIEVIEKLTRLVSPGESARLEVNDYEYEIKYNGALYTVEITIHGMLVMRVEFERFDQLFL